MKLVIAEKPSVGAEIASVLGANEKKKEYCEGNGFIVSWCNGHLVEFAKPETYDSAYKKWSTESLPIIPKKWKFEVLRNLLGQYWLLKELLCRADVDEIICATDAGREGECIFRYIYRLSGCNKPVKRLWISSVEHSEIEKGFESLKPDSNYDNLFQAGLARAKADWLVGINFSRLFSCLHNLRLTIGRVQTPTLNIIVQRDEEIQNFVPKKYYTIVLQTDTVTAESGRYDDYCEAYKQLLNCNKTQAVIKDIRKEEKHITPPKLFDLGELQKKANILFDFTAKQTLDMAQALYEKKLISYPRTSSNYVTSSMTEKMKQLVPLSAALLGTDMKSENISAVVDDTKVNDHHAIVPTININDKTAISKLMPSQFKLLMLICSQLLCAVSSEYIFERTIVNIACGDIQFKAKGDKVRDMGFKEIENYCIEKLTGKPVEKKECVLPEILAAGLVLEKKCNVQEHLTVAPKHYTDASLIEAMECAGNDSKSCVGIGTQATRALMIEKIIKSGYVERKGKNLIPTEMGKKLIEIVPEEVRSANMTAEWEEKLHLIEHGEYSASNFMNDITAFVMDMVKKYKGGKYE